MRKNDFNHFTNLDCRYFPCHDTVPMADFNCLFCYCPLFAYADCGGNYKVLESGVKDCSDCTRNHDKDSWKFIVGRLREVNNYMVKFNELKTKS